MPKLYEKETRKLIGTISEDDFRFLADHLEEESPDDTDYYMNQATLEMLVEAGASPGLVTLLRQALGEREEIEIQWDSN
jgi:processive 1,2-diacylglycerol beta-glucosyltransferase